jgi:hypothetical protein
MGLLTAGVGLAMTRTEFNAASIQQPVRHAFFAAGVRFQPSAPIVTTGAIVSLRCEDVTGASAYAILVDGAKIGYVPKAIAQGLGEPESWQAYLQAVDQDGLPWKRYKVKLVSRG